MAAKRKKAKKQGAMYVLEYSHGHGTDLFLCASSEDALTIQVNTILSWITDIRNETMRDRILAAIAEKNFRDAVSTWEEYQGEEAMEPESFQLHHFKGPMALGEAGVVKIARDLIAEIANGNDPDDP